MAERRDKESAPEEQWFPPPEPVVPRDAAPATGLADLAVRTDPFTVRRGETIRLILEYRLGSPSRVVESFELRLRGQALPNFPRTEQLDREGGSHTSAFAQKIPAVASLGSYEFKGEVCAGGDCVSRTVQFEIVP